MKKTEILLLTAIALAWGAQAVWAPRPSGSEMGASSWKEQEKKTRSEIRRTMGTNRSALEAKFGME